MMKRRRRGRPLDGWLILDKPQGPTSTDMVNKLKRLFDAEKAGHGGTLDPLATGLLPIAFGAATKTVPYVMDGTKRYRFTLRFGEARSPATLMAEKMGGTCMMLPRKAGSAASMAASSGRTAVVSITWPSASSVSRASPKRSVKR
jgi:hypothetical protein